jgi:hypothetical protein
VGVEVEDAVGVGVGVGVEVEVEVEVGGAGSSYSGGGRLGRALGPPQAASTKASTVHLMRMSLSLLFPRPRVPFATQLGFPATGAHSIHTLFSASFGPVHPLSRGCWSRTESGGPTERKREK